MRKLASIQRIWKIEPIEGADKIELAHVLGWQCVVNKGHFQPMDLGVYFEMLDFELAKIYAYETKRFNEQVKNNIAKFPERYRFQLTRGEANSVMSKKTTSPKNYFSGQSGGTRKLPYAFTEHGIYILMTVLKKMELHLDFLWSKYLTLNKRQS